jgi:hypothetical protein
VRTFLHCKPKYPAYKLVAYMMPRKNGCTNAAVRPSSKPNSPPFANASCADNTMGDDAMVVNKAVRPTSSDDDDVHDDFFSLLLLLIITDVDDLLLDDDSAEDDERCCCCCF